MSAFAVQDAEATVNLTGVADAQTVVFTVAANPNSGQRTGSITIGDKTFGISQEGTNCSYSISPTSQTLDASAATKTVSVTASAGCSWTATSNAPERTATLTIAGQTFTITQRTAIPPVQLTSAVSRKTHGGVAAFDINLPLSGTPGVESRTSGANGEHTVIFTFTNPITSVGGAGVSGIGNVSTRASGSDAHEYIVNLTGVANAQKITVTLTNVTDSLGNHSDSVPVSIGLLLGDSNNGASVNSGDAQQTRNRSGQATDPTNFRSDYNLDGTINSGDSFIARSRSGQFIP